MKPVMTALFQWILVGIYVTSCANNETEVAREGSAEVRLIASALSEDDIEKMRVTVSGPNINPDIVANLPKDPAGGWVGTIENIPAGDDRVFLGEALDPDGQVLYRGSAEEISIVADTKTSVTLFLQEVNPAPEFSNTVPLITSFIVSDMEITPGETVEVGVVATDRNPNDVLTYQWHATGGTLSSPYTPFSDWTAPVTPGSYTLTATVTDSKNAATTAAVSLSVLPASEQGEALVSLTINTWPAVTGLVPTPARIAPGETLQLSLEVEDSDGDTLTFEWQSDCEGTFSDSFTQNPEFTSAQTLSTDFCTLTVEINDNRGGSTTGRISVQIGADITPVQCRPEDLLFTITDVPVTVTGYNTALGDLNADGRLDIVETPRAYEIAVLTSEGATEFASPVYYPIGSSGPGGTASAVADLNGDGFSDVIAVNYEDDYMDGSMSIFLGDGTGRLTFNQRIPSSVVGINPASVTVADLNGDSKPDLITGNLNGQDRLRIIFQDTASFEFSVHELLYLGDNNEFSNVADLDGDQDLDIVAGASATGTFVLLNDGFGSFDEHQRLTSETLSAKNTLGDFDLDGDVDVAVRMLNRLEVFLNDGAANFEQSGTYQSEGRNLFIASGDLNLDGILDLVVPTDKGNEIHLYFGTGDGSFSPVIVIPLSTWVIQAAVGNVIGNSRPEIVFGPRNGTVISIVELSCLE